MTMRGVFVTGTDTGVGKTVVSALLVLAMEADYWKPIQTGAAEGTDTAAVAKLTGLPPDRFHPSAWELQAPLSPHKAARQEGRTIALADFRLPDTNRPLVVEGAGGVLVPLSDTATMLDLMVDLGLPVVVAARSGLGTINHTLLTLEALRARGLTVLGTVLVGPPNPANHAAVERYGRVRILAEVEPLEPLTPETVAAKAAGMRVDLQDGPEQSLPERDTLRLDKAHVWHPFTQAATAPAPVEVVSASGATLVCADGRRLTDLVSSWWVTLHGHAHPRIAAALAAQARTMEQVIFADFTHAPAARLAARLARLLTGPGGDGPSRVFYSDNGSTSVEAALKMAFQYWRNQGQSRRRFLAFQGGYHGDTVGAMSAGYSSGFYTGFEPLLFDVRFLPFPATWEDDDSVLLREEEALAALERELSTGDVAAVLAEPLVQGAAGMRMCRPEFLRELASRCRGRTLLILDEVMTGFGRTGTMFACHRAGVRPDIVCLAKGLTGGFLPLAATVCREEVFEAFLGQDFGRAFAHGHSFTANPLGCAAALASLDLFEEEGTLTRITAMESLHRRRLSAMAADPHLAGRFRMPRAMGCIAALDIEAGDTGYTAPVGPLLKRLLMERGFYLRPLGHVLYLMPPACIPPERLEQAWDAVADALASLAR